MRDRRYSEGPGIRAGDLELHPGIGGEFGYDSNWFLRSHKSGPNIINAAPLNPVQDGALLRITPSLSLSTLGAQRTTDEGTPAGPRVLQFRATLAATYREFFGSKELRDQRNVSANASARADINAGRPIALGIFGGWQRLIQPAVVSDPNLSFNRDDVFGGAEVIAMPGGGTLDLRGSYTLRANLFEEQNGTPFNRLNHEVAVRTRWRFRPRTALFHETSLAFVSYPNAARAFNYLNDATPVKTRFGLTGLLTEWFGTTLSAGYGATFFRNPAAPSSKQYDSFTAQAEGTFYLSKTAGAGGEPGQETLLLSTLGLGYIHDFQLSFLGNYFTSDKGYARVEYWFGGKTVFTITGSAERLGYPPVFINGANGAPQQVTGDFANLRVGGDLFAEYRFTNAFGINTTIDYHQNISDTVLPAGAVPTAGGAVPAGAQQYYYDLNWRRLQAFIGARVFF